MADTSQNTIEYLKFPYASETPRLSKYGYYKRLFMGKHFEAFKLMVDDPRYSKEYERLRYITANFPALISKVASDINFIEPPKIQVQDGDQIFIDNLISENTMRVQQYESSLQNSYFGDALFKLRVGKRSAMGENTVIIDQVTPRIYFPHYDHSNITGHALKQELAWIVTIGTKKYLRKEIHSAGLIENELWEMDGDEHKGYQFVQQADLKLLGSNIPEQQETGIDRSLLIHIPNFRAGEMHNGISDYFDLDSLFYAINNRMTKIDNILDKHGDPILLVPQGILDEEGKVRKKSLGVIEMGEDETGKPEYIVWDAKLESAENELDHLIDTALMISETSPIVAGRDKDGNIESGRALKYKMLRTIAKAQRKQLYYREGLIDLYYTAQKLAKAHGATVEGKRLEGNPVKPEIIWSDGLPADMTEMISHETQRVDAGLTSKVEAIMRLDDIDRDAAEKKVKEIQKEGQIALESSMKTAADFGKRKGVDAGDEEDEKGDKKANGFTAIN